jgi:hypothetical protein
MRGQQISDGEILDLPLTGDSPNPRSFQETLSLIVIGVIIVTVRVCLRERHRS